jgi:hypothetical protein
MVIHATHKRSFEENSLMFCRHHAACALILFGVVPAAVVSGSCAVNEFDPQCTDGITSGDETDIDCGGPHCGPCAEDQMCVQGSDCLSRVCGTCTKAGCTGNVCTMPSCDDKVVDGDETDVDCGGSCPKACAEDMKCGAGTDCASTSCSNGVCVSPCNNTTTDGSETDTDCGGSCTKKCAEDKKCGVGSDCASTFCVNAVCVSPCHNTAKDGSEADVDCGGSCATKCSVGWNCQVHDDCFSGVCTGSFCTPDQTNPVCVNGVRDPLETDVDCGGGACPACGSGEGCELDSDCVKSLKCMGNSPMKTCQMP